MNYYGSICLSDIPKDKITKSEKNGKLYLNINVVKYKEENQYNNKYFICLPSTKEERVKDGFSPCYLGNLKEYEEKGSERPSQEDLNVLPF